MRRIITTLAVLALTLAACGDGDAGDMDDIDQTEADDYSIEEQPAAATASFVSPTDGDTVSSPFSVELAAGEVELTPVGAPAVGEAHLHVTADLGCYDTGERIPGPSDEDEAEGRFHLGDGSDGREIDLEPGTHELCVQLADGIHTAFGETETITVTVE